MPGRQCHGQSGVQSHCSRCQCAGQTRGKQDSARLQTRRVAGKVLRQNIRLHDKDVGHRQERCRSRQNFSRNGRIVVA